MDNYSESVKSNLALAEKIVTKAISENIPGGNFKNATNEQIKKLLVNIVANVNSNSATDGGTF